MRTVNAEDRHAKERRAFHRWLLSVHRKQQRQAKARMQVQP
jgi:hypothetical protein